MDGHIATIDMASLGPAQVVAFTGSERMNAVSTFRVEVALTERPSGEDLVGKPATLKLADEREGGERAIPLVATRVEWLGVSRSLQRYSLTLQSPGWRLGRRRAHRVWVERTTQQIVEELVGGAFHTKWRLSGEYTERLQCVQYGETDWGFLERLLAEEGIAYYWDEDGDVPRLVLADDAQSHDGIEGGPVLYRGGRWTDAGACFFELDVMHQITSAAAHVRDFDVRNPAVLIEGHAAAGPLEVFEFPGGVLTAASATARAKARLDQLRRDEKRLLARGDTMRPRAGYVVEVDGTAEDDTTGRFLVVAVEHDYLLLAPGQERTRPYESRVTMVPSGERTYRPAIVRSAPRVSEIESAVVTGQGGEEIHTDDLARVKVRMFWDRSGIGDDHSSTWSRCVQMSMGGSMLIPRMGWEVPVAYAYGSPDKPVVLGRFYNGGGGVPYALPSAARRTTLQSATSPSDGTTNEIRMDDSAGTEEVFVHATRDQTIVVGGDATEHVGNDEVYDVGLSHALGVKGAQSHSVGASQKVAVGTDHALTVKGARNETIGATEKIDVTGDVLVVVKGAYTEMIGALHGLECNQSNTVVKGAFSQSIGGSLNVASGMGTSQNVAAARSETVGGAQLISASKYTENVRGTKTVTAGATSDKAASDLVTKVKGDASVTASSLDLGASGPIVIKASEISFEISGSLTAGALTLSSSTFKATKGTTKVKGSIKRQGETKIE